MIFVDNIFKQRIVFDPYITQHVSTYSLGLITEFEESLNCIAVAQFLLPCIEFSAATTYTTLIQSVEFKRSVNCATYCIAYSIYILLSSHLSLSSLLIVQHVEFTTP